MWPDATHAFAGAAKAGRPLGGRPAHLGAGGRPARQHQRLGSGPEARAGARARTHLHLGRWLATARALGCGCAAGWRFRALADWCVFPSVPRPVLQKLGCKTIVESLGNDPLRRHVVAPRKPAPYKATVQVRRQGGPHWSSGVAWPRSPLQPVPAQRDDPWWCRSHLLPTVQVVPDAPGKSRPASRSVSPTAHPSVAAPGAEPSSSPAPDAQVSLHLC